MGGHLVVLRGCAGASVMRAWKPSRLFRHSSVASGLTVADCAVDHHATQDIALSDFLEAYCRTEAETAAAFAAAAAAEAGRREAAVAGAAGAAVADSAAGQQAGAAGAAGAGAGSAAQGEGLASQQPPLLPKVRTRLNCCRGVATHNQGG